MIWAAPRPSVAILTSFTGWIYARSALAQENDQLLGALLSRIPMFLYVGLFIALVVATLFVVVMRFYKGLLKEEGYLMHTLPVKEWQLIASKGVTATVTVLISMVLAAVSIVLLNLVGNLSGIGELFQAVGEACRKHPESFLYALEALLVVLAGIMTEVYKIYTSLSIGQLMTKHRMIWSVAAYIGMGRAYPVWVDAADRVRTSNRGDFRPDLYRFFLPADRPDRFGHSVCVLRGADRDLPCGQRTDSQPEAESGVGVRKEARAALQCERLHAACEPCKQASASRRRGYADRHQARGQRIRS